MLQGGVLLFTVGFASVRVARLVEDIPTSKIRSIAMGMVEITGKVHKPLHDFVMSPLMKQKCVWYRLEKYRRQGKSGYWALVKEFAEPFYVKDNTGMVLVHPRGAVVDVSAVTTVFNEREKVILPQQGVYVLGTAGDNPYKAEATAVTGVEDIMIKDAHKPFYISDKGERGFVKKYRFWGWLLLMSGCGLIGVGMFLLLSPLV